MKVDEKKTKSTITGFGKIARFRDVYDASPKTRINLVRNGVQAEGVKVIVARMAVSQDWLLSRLRLSAATVNRKAKEGGNLSMEDGERVLGVLRLIGQAQALVETSGDAEGFDAARWVAGWLDTPLPALGGESPGNYMDTMEGQVMVSELLSRASSGAYA